MTVAQLVRHLQSLGIELQDAPVTFVADDFPRKINQSEIADGAVYTDHYHIEYFPESSEEKLFKIVVLRS
jgi:adenylate kinase family enzyme